MAHTLELRQIRDTQIASTVWWLGENSHHSGMAVVAAEPWLSLVVVVVAVERGCGWLWRILPPPSGCGVCLWGAFVVMGAAVGGCGRLWDMDCCMETIEVHTKGLMRAEWEAEREPVT